MRDLLFKNLTSQDKRRKVISTSEVTDNAGVHSVIRRHFICIVKEIKDSNLKRPLPYLYVLKARDSRERKESFFCKIKGSLYGVYNGRLFLIIFMHSLKIELVSISGSFKKISP